MSKNNCQVREAHLISFDFPKVKRLAIFNDLTLDNAVNVKRSREF
jgi:hypothetical protein